MSVKSFGNYILVKSTEEAERKSDGGILLTAGVVVQEKSKKSIVVSVSDALRARFLKEMDGLNVSFVEVGNIVHHKYHAGTHVYIDGEEYTSLHYDEVLTVQESANGEETT